MNSISTEGVGSDQGPSRVFEVKRDAILLKIRDKEFLITGMNDQESEIWTTSRLMVFWRNIVVFRQMSATVSGSIIDLKHSDKSEAEKDAEEILRDKHINKLASEWATLNNSLVATALKIVDPDDIEFIKTLDKSEKLQIITAQDQLNGLDLMHKIAEIEKVANANKALQDAIDRRAEEKIEEEYLLKPKKLSKKVAKKRKEQKKKKGKK